MLILISQHKQRKHYLSAIQGVIVRFVPNTETVLSDELSGEVELNKIVETHALFDRKVP